MSLRSTAQVLPISILLYPSHVSDERLLCAPHVFACRLLVIQTLEVEADQLDRPRHSQEAKAVEDLRHDPSRDEAQHEEHDDAADRVAERVDRGVAFIGRRRVTPKQEAREHAAEEAAIAVYGYRANRVIDLEPPLDPVMQLVGDIDA